MVSTRLDIPIFTGQGTAAANGSATRNQALHDSTSAAGSLLLSTCSEIFHTELASLSPDELQQVDIDKADFQTRDALLSDLSERYPYNALISGTRLFLIQSLRYLAIVESFALSNNSLTPFSDVLGRNAQYNAGILGFSSGILPACVAGTSLSTIEYVSHAAETYRLAFWIGVRVQQFRVATLKNPNDACLSWSLAFLGLSKSNARASIANFVSTTSDPSPLLNISAVMDGRSVTISGRPDTLAAFSATVTGQVIVCRPTVDTLYHSPVHVAGVRQQVFNDIARRQIRFPHFKDIKFPIRSTFTGQLLDRNTTSGSLVESVVDMLLTQVVNWDVVVNELVKALPKGTLVRLLNVGPGTGLLRSTKSSFAKGTVSFLDLSVADAMTNEKKFSPKQEPIAIIGMAVNMPGAPNTDKLWEVLEQGMNTISEIPEQRFKVSDYNDPKDAKTTRRMKAHTGNFIDKVDEFDNEFFRISPREAKSMDPQQRILLHTAYEALENAGYVPNATPTFQQDSIGCYIGVATHDYLQNLREDIDVYYTPGTVRAFLSGRISYAMQLSGPSVVLDTACSSSVVAIHQACRALMNKDCTAALAGGVNIISSPDMFLGLDRGHLLSPTGQCKPFDVSADGYSRSEGCGIIILKRLSDAVAENDNIMGVIRGVEVNQSGLAYSITQPHPPTQSALFRSVLENSGIEARHVSVVEAHGAGTQIGDPSEMESIRSVFAVNRTAANPLHITSIKANIGHLEAASGAASLAKLLLMLRHRTIPRQISLKTLNPRIAPLNRDHTIIDTFPVPWEPALGCQPRIAVLNNFGAAGSNGAILLEEFTSANNPHSVGLHHVFGLSAKTEESLEELRKRFISWIEDPTHEAVRNEDIAYTVTARRQVFPYRLAVSAGNKKELVRKLGTAHVVHPTEERGKVVFVFSGQGGQYLGMGGSLYNSSPLFRCHIDRCHSILTSQGFPGILPIILADSSGSGLMTLEELEAYQAAIFSLEYALAQLWMSWGLIPCAVVGHSLGEYTSLVIADVLTLKDALTIIANRARFMVQTYEVGSTGMVAVNLESAAIQHVISSSEAFSHLSIACYNSSVDCVVSGPIEQLNSFRAHLDSEVHCKNVLLAIPFGCHSSAMQPVLEDLVNVARRMAIRTPSIPIVSNVFGDVVMPGDSSVFNAEYFARHCAEPVMFDQGIRSLVSELSLSDSSVWVEIGPHITLLPMLTSNACLSKDALFLGSMRKQQDVWSTLTASLSQLYLSNVSLVWRKVFSHLPSVSCVELPSYPFQKLKFWVSYKDETLGGAETLQTLSSETCRVLEYPMLYRWAQHPSADNGNVAVFETPIANLAATIKAHVVGGVPLCPASVYIEQVLAGIHLAKKYLGFSFGLRHVVLRDIQFVNPLVYNVGDAGVVRTTLTLHIDGTGPFVVSSHLGSKELVHVHGDYRFLPTLTTTVKFSRTLPVITRRISALTQKGGEFSETFSTRTVYEVIFPRVVNYAKEYHTVQRLTVDPSATEGHATVKLPPDHDRATFVVHPIFLDTLFHVAGFIANMQGGINDVYICSEVGSIETIPELIDNDAAYTIYCSNTWLAHKGIMLSDTYAVHLSEPRKIVAQMKGIQFRRVRLTNLKRGLILAAGQSILASTQNANLAAEGSALFSKTATVSCHQPSPQEDVASIIEAEVVEVVSKTCDIDGATLNRYTDLGTLGVDSLMTIELLWKLQAAFPNANLNAQVLSSCRIIAEIVQEIASKSSQGQSETSPRIWVPNNDTMEPSGLVLDDEPKVDGCISSILDIALVDSNNEAGLNSGLDVLTGKALQGLDIDLSADASHDHTTTHAIQSNLSAHHQPTVRLAATSPSRGKFVGVLQSDFGNAIEDLRLNDLPVSLQTSRTHRLPLFLFHDGSGLVNYYERLPPLHRNVWALYNPRFITAQPWDGGLIQMVTHYVDYVSKVSSGIPILLGGWSFGGILAFEAACQLLKRGVAVKGVLLIDTPSPVDHNPLPSTLIHTIVNLYSRNATSEIGRLVGMQFEMNSHMLCRYHPLTGNGPYPPLALLRSSEGFSPDGIVDVPTWLADRGDPRQPGAGWEKLVGVFVKTWGIPGNHFEPFHPSNIVEVADCMNEGCEYLESL